MCSGYNPTFAATGVSIGVGKTFVQINRGWTRAAFGDVGAFPRHIFQTAARTAATQRAVACRRGRREAVRVTAPQPVAAQDDVIFNEPGRRASVAWGDGGKPPLADAFVVIERGAAQSAN